MDDQQDGIRTVLVLAPDDEEVPPFAALEVWGYDADAGALLVRRPTRGSATDVLFNGPGPIEPGGTGQAVPPVFQPVGWYDDGSIDVTAEAAEAEPQPGQTLGTVPGEWFLARSQSGYVVHAVYGGAGGKLALVAPQTSRPAAFVEVISAGDSAADGTPAGDYFGRGRVVYLDVMAGLFVLPDEPEPVWYVDASLADVAPAVPNGTTTVDEEYVFPAVCCGTVAGRGVWAGRTGAGGGGGPLRTVNSDATADIAATTQVTALITSGVKFFNAGTVNELRGLSASSTQMGMWTPATSQQSAGNKTLVAFGSGGGVGTVSPASWTAASLDADIPNHAGLGGQWDAFSATTRTGSSTTSGATVRFVPITSGTLAAPFNTAQTVVIPFFSVGTGGTIKGTVALTAIVDSANKPYLLVGCPTGVGTGSASNTVSFAVLRGTTISPTLDATVAGLSFLSGLYVGGTLAVPAASVTGLSPVATSGNYADLTGTPVIFNPALLGSLPSAAFNYGVRAMITDATAPAFGVVAVGGGAVIVPVYSDGSNWRVG